ncbi:MAG: hypothetical protein FIA97_08950 [Methylococcaceae bacterium]|nr:hypothetical protein [Methylococcaceae bacterium]
MRLADGDKIYSGKIGGAAIMLVGLLSLGISILLPFAVGDPLLGVVLMGLPLLLLGGFELVSGFASFATRIEIHQETLVLSAPAWRGCPLPPVRKLSPRWEEVQAVRYRAEIYHLLPGGGLPFPVTTYAIETQKGRMILGGKLVPGLAEAMAEIAHRSGCSVSEERPVTAGILRVLFKGPPSWP